MLDLFSGGRIISGFVRGIGVEHWANNISPVVNRERFEESHDLIVRTWTEPGPFSWEGKHFQFRYVNPWLFPLQKPHPPIWVPGIGSEETIRMGRAPRLSVRGDLLADGSRRAAFRAVPGDGGEVRLTVREPRHFGYTLGCFVGDSEKTVRAIL